MQKSIRKIDAKINVRINRIIAFLHQLQQNIKPDIWVLLLTVSMFIITAVANLFEYYSMDKISLALNYILLFQGIILFIYQAYKQYTFLLISDARYRIVKNRGSIYEIQIIQTA